MTPIHSPHNTRLKEARALQRAAGRSKSGRFVAEGEDLLAAARAAGWAPVERLVAEGSGLEGTEVDAELLGAASSLGSGTRALGVFEQRWGAVTGPLCVALWGVRDPGNVGAVLRSALAFGASSVALGPDTADPFGPKAVRASMGAIFQMPVARVASIAQLPSPRVALVAAAGEPVQGPLQGTLVIGAERAGLPPEVVEACEAVAHIPIAGDSLNAAMAATIALYESTRVPAR